MAQSKLDRGWLTLGWQVTPTHEPRYWLDPNARPGGQEPTDLVRVRGDAVGFHTAIIAQSGSGKSFFLGRLIEEIVTQTRSRLVVLDPNADFRRVYEVEDGALWAQAGYDRHKRRGRLPHEAGRGEFLSRWPSKDIQVLTRTANRGHGSKNQIPLLLSWTSLSMDFLAEDLDPMLRSDLNHCHAFVQDLARLIEFNSIWDQHPSPRLIDEAEKYFRQAKTPGSEFRSNIEEAFSPRQLRAQHRQRALEVLFSRPGFRAIPPPLDLAVTRQLVEARSGFLRKRVARAPQYIDESVGHFYFSKAREFEAARILDPRPGHDRVATRLTVVDLPSLEKATRLLAINAILSDEWRRVREEWERALSEPGERDSRVPTFVVVDEAHNLIPAEPRSKAELALREQFRTIVSEGRKYGLYLILVSQRPDKLDPQVLSECENKALMRLSSGGVVETARRLLGLDDAQPRLLEKCLDFDTGRVLLLGRWAPEGSQVMYCAARRTIEGGRDRSVERRVQGRGAVR